MIEATEQQYKDLLKLILPWLESYQEFANDNYIVCHSKEKAELRGLISMSKEVIGLQNREEA